MPPIKYIRCGGCACFTIVILTFWSIFLSLGLAVALNYGGAHFGSHVYLQSGKLLNSPFGQTLDGSGAPLVMTLPDDLAAKNFLDRTYSATARDAAAHVISIAPSTFDGGFTVATFDGNVGSTITYRVVAKDRIHVISNFGVMLS